MRDAAGALGGATSSGLRLLLALIIGRAAPQPAVANGNGSTRAPLTGAETSAVDYALQVLPDVLVVLLGGLASMELQPGIVGRAIGAAAAVVASALVRVVLAVLSTAFVLLASWSFYTGTVAPTDIVSMPPALVRLARWDFPLQPDWNNCAQHALKGVAEELVWSTAFMALGGAGLSATDVLVTAGIACMTGGSGSDGSSFSRQIRISQIASDWATKGAHIHVGKVELAIRPGSNGTIVFRSVFSSTSQAEVASAVRVAERALQDIAFRRQLHSRVAAAIEHLSKSGNPQWAAKSGELKFLLVALEKMGV